MVRFHAQYVHFYVLFEISVDWRIVIVIFRLVVLRARFRHLLGLTSSCCSLIILSNENVTSLSFVFVTFPKVNNRTAMSH